MKKVLLVLLLTVVSVGAFAQQGSLSGTAKVGYQSEFKRFGIGVEGRYEIVDNVRLAPELTFFFPKNRVMGLDVNLNAQYTLRFVDKLTIYPLAGLNISNNRAKYDEITDINLSTGDYSTKSKSVGVTNFGFNLGAGVDYDLSATSYINFDMKYTFSKVDYGQFMFGYGIRF